MTNNGLKQLIEKYKDRLCYIMLDNSIYLLCEYKDSVPESWLRSIGNRTKAFMLKDITYDSFDGVDFFSMPMIASSTRPIVTARIWHKTECIQRFGVMDEGMDKYRIDPILFIR